MLQVCRPAFTHFFGLPCFSEVFSLKGCLTVKPARHFLSQFINSHLFWKAWGVTFFSSAKILPSGRAPNYFWKAESFWSVTSYREQCILKITLTWRCSFCCCFYLACWELLLWSLAKKKKAPLLQIHEFTKFPFLLLAILCICTFADRTLYLRWHHSIKRNDLSYCLWRDASPAAVGSSSFVLFLYANTSSC